MTSNSSTSSPAMSTSFLMTTIPSSVTSFSRGRWTILSLSACIHELGARLVAGGFSGAVLKDSVDEFVSNWFLSLRLDGLVEALLLISISARQSSWIRSSVGDVGLTGAIGSCCTRDSIGDCTLSPRRGVLWAGAVRLGFRVIRLAMGTGRRQSITGSWDGAGPFEVSLAFRRLFLGCAVCRGMDPWAVRQTFRFGNGTPLVWRVVPFAWDVVGVGWEPLALFVCGVSVPFIGGVGMPFWAATFGRAAGAPFVWVGCAPSVHVVCAPLTTPAYDFGVSRNIEVCVRSVIPTPLALWCWWGAEFGKLLLWSRLAVTPRSRNKWSSWSSWPCCRCCCACPTTSCTVGRTRCPKPRLFRREFWLGMLRIWWGLDKCYVGAVGEI